MPSFSSLDANPAVVSRRETAARKVEVVVAISLLNPPPLIFFFFLICSRFQLEELRQDKETFASMGKVDHRISAGLDIAALLHEEKHSLTPKFVHAQPLIAALRRGEEKFDVVERNVDVDEWDSDDDEDKGRAIFETTTSYHLNSSPDNYLNLDDIKDEDASSHIRGLSEDHILHCGRALESGLRWQSGSIVLGTERGAWSRIPHVSRHLDETFSSLPINHAVVRRKEGFLVLRRITEVHATDDADCTKIHTEPVHPIELFEKFRVESLGLRPYNHNYGKYEVVADQNQEQVTTPERELFSKYAKPDSPVVKCTDTSFAPFTDGYFGNYGVVIPSTPAATDDKTSFAAEISPQNGGCIEYSKDFDGGFNFNYDPTTKGAITQSLPLGGTSITGVTCEGCYAYLGAGFLLIFEYSSCTLFSGCSISISAEGKIAGTAGFNANVKIVNPTISGSAYVKLVPAASSWATIPLGSGLSFEYKFGGLTALVSGSGAATGSASFGAGLSVSASLAAKYASSTFSFPHSFTGSSVTPYYTSTGFTTTSVSATATLTGTENFGFVYGALLTVSFLFDGNVDGTLKNLMGTAFSSKSTAQVVVVPPSVSWTIGRALSGSNDKGAGYFMPGDSMTIQFAYDGYPRQEAITLFYSYTKTSGEVMNIMMHHFNTSATGTGVLEATWLVPWDEFLSEEWPQKESQITVKASTDISKEYSTISGFGVKIFTEVDGIFLSPAPGEMVPVDTPYEVKWNSSLLKTFVPNAWNRPDGKMVVASTVVFDLCGEILATNGTILTSWCDNFEHDRPHLNVGSAQVVFSSNFTARADRYYLNVHSQRHLHVYGWSPGYFRLITGRVSSAAQTNLRVANVDVSSPKVFRRQVPRTESSPLTEAKRKLDSTAVDCSSNGATSSVSFGSNMGGSPKALALAISGVYTYTVPMPSTSGAASVVDPTATCYGSASTTTTDNSAVGAIIGGVVGGLLAIAIIGCLVFFIVSRRRAGGVGRVESPVAIETDPVAALVETPVITTNEPLSTTSLSIDVPSSRRESPTTDAAPFTPALSSTEPPSMSPAPPEINTEPPRPVLLTPLPPTTEKLPAPLLDSPVVMATSPDGPLVTVPVPNTILTPASINTEPPAAAVPAPASSDRLPPAVNSTELPSLPPAPPVIESEPPSLTRPSPPESVISRENLGGGTFSSPKTLR